MKAVALAFGVLLLAAPAAALADEPPPSGPIDCDRACLTDLMDRTLAAMVAHDPKRLPLAPSARYTENGQELEIGDGFWATASGMGAYKHYFLDPRTAQAGFYGVMKEGPNNAILALRIRLEGRKISEIEAILGRTGLGQASPNGSANLERMGKPDAIWLQDVPPARRASRADLIRVADMYFTGLENNDGKGTYPFTDDCYRLENGIQTTKGPHPSPPRPANATGPNMFALGCKEGFETGYFRFVTRIRDRRYPLVDEDKQVVFSYAYFDHAGNVNSYRLADGTPATNGIRAPFTWQIAEVFRIEGGKMRVIEAVLNNVPYGTRGGWEGK